MGGSVKGAAHHAWGQNTWDPIADDLLEQWRHNCRDWLARLYAFAVPNKAALDELATVSPIVEVGAGTGYWASLLRSQGVDVVAYDSIPPSSEDSSNASFGRRRSKQKRGSPTMNEYHGAAAQFTEVLRGSADMLGSASDASHALFLCYPPRESQWHLTACPLLEVTVSSMSENGMA